MGLIERLRNYWTAIKVVRTQQDILDRLGVMSARLTLRYGGEDTIDMLDAWCQEWQRGNQRLPLADYLDRKLEAHDDIVWMAKYRGK